MSHGEKGLSDVMDDTPAGSLGLILGEQESNNNGLNFWDLTTNNQQEKEKFRIKKCSCWALIDGLKWLKGKNKYVMQQ